MIRSKGVVSALRVVVNRLDFPGHDLKDETYLMCNRVGLVLCPIRYREMKMGIVEIILTAIGLSMDAFAVSICKGLSTENVKLRHSLITGLYFGAFQALMPIIGYFLGINFQQAISSIDHWIAFILLALIGIGMIKESRESEAGSDDYGFKTMIVLAIATSIDALAVGISFALLDVDIFFSSAVIGCITFVLSAIGVRAGSRLGCRSRSFAELLGGIILILIGIKILLEHLGVLSI